MSKNYIALIYNLHTDTDKLACMINSPIFLPTTQACIYLNAMLIYTPCRYTLTYNLKAAHTQNTRVHTI